MRLTRLPAETGIFTPTTKLSSLADIGGVLIFAFGKLVSPEAQKYAGDSAPNGDEKGPGLAGRRPCRIGSRTT
jgi:hypothetical protein